MLAAVSYDVVAGPSRPIPLILVGFFLCMVAWEAGILALWGVRPYGKAFGSSFLVNMSVLGAGFIGYLIASSYLQGPGGLVFLIALTTVVHGLVLSANRHNLSLGRAWLATLTMKACSLVAILALLYWIQS